VEFHQVEVIEFKNYFFFFYFSRVMNPIITKIEQSLSSQDYYQGIILPTPAHQLYNTLITRSIKHKNTAEAVNYIYDGCKVMLDAGQAQSAFDLLNQLLKIQVDNNQIAKLFSSCPNTSKTEFISKVCAWFY
jgi:hypothetical protein